ncbi:MAG: hypothetical protein J0665_18215 [Deltaproteobacteria bacterium]|nr:hypothetical protein [Deltaproteobacteria bacterium]
MKTVICKPDLDTCLTALVLGVTKNDTIVCVCDHATADDLADSAVCCIECGGSGDVALNNFDHHNPSLSLPPACRQAFDNCRDLQPGLVRLVDYVCLVDDPSPKRVCVGFPSLSNVFSGMLMTIAQVETQFRCGMELLQKVLDDGDDPFSPMIARPEWYSYVTAKSENAKSVAELDIPGSINFFSTVSGIKAGCLSLTGKHANLIVGPGSLYEKGIEIAIVYSHAFGLPPIRKFTIASLNRQVSHLLPHIARIESGWGGRASIIGSPRNRNSHLSEKIIMDLVRDYA